MTVGRVLRSCCGCRGLLAMRVAKVRMVAFTTGFLATIWFLHSILLSYIFGNTIVPLDRRDALFASQECRHPDLDPFEPSVTKFIKDLGKLTCKTEPNWLIVKEGLVAISEESTKAHGDISCKISYIKRKNDFSNDKAQEISFTSNGKLSLQEDFFLAECKGSDGVNWRSIMAGVHRNQPAVDRAKSHKESSDSMKLNVLIFGLDSMSRLHYIRKLPKTYEYLTKELKAVVLKGYNIVGDGTPQALIPILTSYTEKELPETRKRMSNANYVNIYPFIWKNFTEHGYVTAFGEDLPSTGIFTYRLKGFDKLPTDHYMRTYYVEADKVLNKQPHLCMGSIPRHKIMLSWLRQFFDVYKDIPKFAFGFQGELSHDDYNLVGYADEDIREFLKGLNDDGILNTTLLILMSDHGHRFASIRETQQGKLEERMPFFSITVPPWFEKKYPSALDNLRKNTDYLSTPFDIYSTLMAVLHPQVPDVGDINTRSISLFSKIPQTRTCAHADIEPHWCTCLDWQSISTKDKIVVKVGQAVIDFINDYTTQFSQLCSRLVVDKITRAEILQPNKALLKFKKNADKDGFVGDFSDNTKVSEAVYQIQFYAFPSKAGYEASVKYNLVTKKFSVKETEISRINMYGKQPHCIYDTYPQLRKYCYCKVHGTE